MKEGKFVAQEEPLSLVRNVLLVGWDRRRPLVGREGVPVHHGEPTSSLVTSTALSVPHLVPRDGLDSWGLVCTAMSFTYCKDLVRIYYLFSIEFIMNYTYIKTSVTNKLFYSPPCF